MDNTGAPVNVKSFSDYFHHARPGPDRTGAGAGGAHGARHKKEVDKRAALWY